MENIYIISNGELRHHGVKGQRWGIRRYQNKDGSLTPAGRKRADKDLKKKKGYRNKEDPVKSMSDEELNKKVNRLQKENQYRQLTKTQADKNREMVSKMLSSAISQVGTQLLVNMMKTGVEKGSSAMKKAIKNYGDNIVPDGTIIG